jgi:Methyl-accepting chemotaxis protein (MCP) signalling domain/Cache domain
MSTNLWTKVNTFSFKAKATLLAIGLGIIPIAITGTISYFQINQTIEQQTVRIQRTRAEAVADKLNRFIFERYGDVEVLAALPFFANSKVAAITSTADKSAILEQYVKSYRVYDSIAAFDIKGNLIAQSKGEPLNKNHLQRKYFQDVLKTGRAVISDPEASIDTGKISLFFAAPIRDSTGQMIGVVRTRLPAERLETVIKNFATKSEDYHILDRHSNKLFISSNGEYTNQPETPDMKESRTKGGVVFHLNKVSDHQQRANTASDPTKATEKDHGELFTAAALTKLEGMPELPWTAVVTIDRDAAYVELQGLLLTIITGAGFTTLFTVAFATFFADRIAKYIQRAISTITNSANEIVDTVQFQEIAVNQQANSAIVTANTINQLESISSQTAAQASASATGARQALSLAEEGTQAVQATLRGMSGLRDSVDEIALQIVNLGEQTGQITNVSDLVADLAKQTNMLALKAAVEAARVGEQGKGFGVVAGEIRKLAEESKKSAQKINTLATDIQSAINRTVMVTDLGTKTVTEGIQLAENTAVTFIGVTDAVNNVFLNSQQISSSAKQQATAIQQVLGAMTTISQGSQESAVGMHRVKTSTRELNQIADELQAVVS